MTATTSTCLSCHDGTVASAIHVERGESHPVDLSYDDAQFRNSGLRPRSALPANLVLPQGKLTCTTCHDGASTEPAKTSLPMHRSQLCFACHDL